MFVMRSKRRRRKAKEKLAQQFWLRLLHRHFFTLAARDYVEQLKVISKGTSCNSLLPSFVRKRLVSSDEL
ncbi:Uncharacterized protein APZ42_022398 [Daphnia magna]|uniref:Uncharacterized protein n=1 Tax=Daphnia magna TaxID=35525 RepID=A0A164VG80_9CRUS|nr:Uncharacterized protein APZ42_022398 [Daphnia magna]